MFKKIVALVAIVVVAQVASAQEYDMESPFGWVRAEISVGSHISFRIRANGRYLIQSHAIALDIGKKEKLGEKEVEPTAERFKVSNIIVPTVAQRSAKLLDEYNGLRLHFSGKAFTIEFRAYDEGFAYRIITDRTDSLKVMDEQAGFDLMGEPEVLLPLQKDLFFSGHENWYEQLPSSKLGTKMSSLPITFLYQDGSAVAFTETDVINYPGASLKGNGQSGLDLCFPQVPFATMKVYDRLAIPSFKRTYLAKIGGKSQLPWRIFMIGESQEMLMGNMMPWLLASESRIEDASWIKPGQAMWDWWHASTFAEPGLETGLNTATYRKYIDFAAANKVAYVVLDEGWYKKGNLLSVNPNMDVPELVKYAHAKGVKVILWVVWRTLQKQFDPAFNQFSTWGVDGIKMDFMMRSDQPMIQFVQRVAAEAAKRKMVVDLHGCHPPKGLQRTYPNVLTMEGVRGLEQNKWSKKLTPAHDCTLPLTRMLAGPMDYTPGSFHNQSQRKFKHKFKRPASQGTRTHELSKYIVYESPLQMLADDPITYGTDTACTRFMTTIPTVWDTTVMLSANAGYHVAVARKSGKTWYIAAMGGNHSQTLHLHTDFLRAGAHSMFSLADGAATATNAMAYDLKRDEVITAGDVLSLKLERGGGWVAKVTEIGQ